LADLFPSTYFVTFLTSAFARANALVAFASFALRAAFLAGGALRSYYLSFATFYCTASCFFKAAFLAGLVADLMADASFAALLRSTRRVTL
jgi:hypothetical protein